MQCDGWRFSCCTAPAACCSRRVPRSHAAVVLYASTAGATDPALGTAFACHLGFKAKAMVDGKPTDFDVFAGQGSYENMPDENGKVGSVPDGRGDSKGGPTDSNQIGRAHV